MAVPHRLTCCTPECSKQSPACGAEARLQRMRQRRRGQLEPCFECSEGRAQRRTSRTCPEVLPEQRRHGCLPQQHLQGAHEIYLGYSRDTLDLDTSQ